MLNTGANVLDSSCFDDAFRSSSRGSRRAALDKVLRREHRQDMRAARHGYLSGEEGLVCCDCGSTDFVADSCVECTERAMNDGDSQMFCGDEDFDLDGPRHHDDYDDGCYDDFDRGDYYAFERHFDREYIWESRRPSWASAFDSIEELHQFLANNGGANLDRSLIELNDRTIGAVDRHDLVLSDFFWNNHENGEESSMAQMVEMNSSGSRLFVERHGHIRPFSGRRGGHNGGGRYPSAKREQDLRDRHLTDMAELDEFLCAMESADKERQATKAAIAKGPSSNVPNSKKTKVKVDGENSGKAKAKSRKSRRRNRKQKPAVHVVEVFVRKTKRATRALVFAGTIAVTSRGTRFYPSAVAA